MRMIRKLMFWRDRCYRYGHKLSLPFVYLSPGMDQENFGSWLWIGLISHYRTCTTCGATFYIGSGPNDYYQIPRSLREAMRFGEVKEDQTLVHEFRGDNYYYIGNRGNK